MENRENAELVYRSGFVSIAGRPNVGKSSLINALLGQKIAAVTQKPQTTRKQQLAILSLETAQIILMDTPGIHHPKHKLGERMNKEAAASFEESDLILILVDGSGQPHEDDILLAGVLEGVKSDLTMILALNKIDLLKQVEIENQRDLYQDIFPNAIPIAISALRGDHLHELLELIVNQLPVGEPFFPDTQLTDLFERDISADLIREAALISLRDEVPHSIAVRIDEFIERGTNGAYIAATLFVERESQKSIVIGKGGEMIKRIGSIARKQIEAMSDRKVYLKLKVKVRKNWRNDEKTLQLFGFRSPG